MKLSPRRRALSKRVFDYSSSPFFLVFFFFFFHDSLCRGATSKWKEGCEIVERTYGSAIPGAVPSLPFTLPLFSSTSSDSFHFSAFDHPGWRIRYSNASELLPFIPSPFLFLPSLSTLTSSSLSTYRLSVAKPHRWLLAGCSSRTRLHPLSFASFFLSFFFHIYHRRVVRIRE